MSEETRDGYEYAEANGLHAVTADDNHLQLDIDVPYGQKSERSEAAAEAYTLIFDRLGLTDVLTVPSRNGNQHTYIKLPRPLPHAARVALQVILGSDPKREALNLLRELFPDKPPYGIQTMLFEEDEQAEKVKEFLKEKEEDDAAF